MVMNTLWSSRQPPRASILDLECQWLLYLKSPMQMHTVCSALVFKNIYMWGAFEGTVGCGYVSVMDQSCVVCEEFGKNF